VSYFSFSVTLSQVHTAYPSSQGSTKRCIKIVTLGLLEDISNPNYNIPHILYLSVSLFLLHILSPCDVILHFMTKQEHPYKVQSLNLEGTSALDTEVLHRTAGTGDFC
jgi:hypothetical protein